MIEPKIVQKGAFTIVGMEASFIGALSPDANNFELVPALWHRFINRLDEVESRTDEACYGLIPTFPISTLRGLPQSATELPDVAE